MICPKCQNLMRTVERQGVQFEQCESCRGVFLDHGELEQVVSAESSYYAAPPAQYQPPPGVTAPPEQYSGGGYRDSPPPYGRGGYADSPPPYGGQGGYRKKRRGGFLEELFD